MRGLYTPQVRTSQGSNGDGQWDDGMRPARACCAKFLDADWVCPLMYEGQVALTMLPWRVGRTVGRTVYAQLGDKPSKRDPLIGIMDSPDLAAHAVAGHNHLLEWMSR